MATRGHLDRLKLFQVFRSLMQRRMTGVLTLQSGREIRRAEIVNGYPVRTASNRRSEGLVANLVEQGLISSTEATRLRAHARQSEAPVDGLLLEHGLISPRRLASVQRAVARQILLGPFGWTEGGYEFVETLIRPDVNAEGIDLVDILVEAAARTVDATIAQQFVRRYAGQFVAPTDLLRIHSARFDTHFPPPNTRTMLEAPTRFDLIARTRGERADAALEVTCMVLAGLARFQKSARVAAPTQSTPPRAAAARSRSIRRVSAPANLSQSAAPSAPPPPSVHPPRRRSSPPRRPGPPPPITAPPPRPNTAAPPRPSAPLPPPSVGPPPSAPPAPPGGAPPRRTARKSRKAKKPPTEKILGLIETAQAENGRTERTHYAVLGLEPGANEAQVRQVFKALARDFHVDKFMRYDLPQTAIDAVQQHFIAINRAHEVLSDAARRTEYDAELSLRAQGIDIGDDGGPDLTKVFAAEKLIKQGAALLKNGKAQPAFERFAEALETIPDDPVGRAGHAYAELLVVQARGAGSKMVQARAIGVLEEVCGELEGRYEPFLYLGRAYRMAGRAEAAVDALKQALKIDPHCAEAASELRHLTRQPPPAKKSIFGRRKK